MDLGTAGHTMESETYITRLDDYAGYKPYGVWKCSTCGAHMSGFKPGPCSNKSTLWLADSRKNIITKCQDASSYWIYQECPVDDPIFMIFGTADLILIKGKDRIVVDYKYTNERNFKALKDNPVLRPSYLDQLRLYGVGTKATAIILHYVNRAQPDQAIDIRVPLPDELFMTKLKRRADQIKNLHNKNKKLISEFKKGTLGSYAFMPKRSCSSKYCDTAGKCIYADTCFKIN